MRAAIGSALVTAGCSSSPSNRTNSSANKPLDKVTHATGFGTYPEESFSYVAVEKGFFREAGIEVKIVPGAGGEVNLGMLATGKADFTEIDYAGALVRAGNGKFDPFRCVAAIHRQTLICFLALTGKGIASPVDLMHKTLGQQAGTVQKTLFPAYARLAGFDASTVTWVNGTPQTLPAMLASGNANAIGSYVTSQPFIQHSTGKEILVLPYSTYLTDLYGSALVASKKLIDTNPDLVHRYTGALLKGLDYTVKNPDEAAAILKKAVPTTEINGAIAGIKTLVPYVGPGQNGGAFGEFDQGKVARGTALLQGLGLYQNGFAPERVVDFGTIAAVSKAQ
jgi:ABC-type nitrate/sulfonate/bicarbonate transport systems, periplasmic components